MFDFPTSDLPLSSAARAGNLDEVRRLLAAGGGLGERTRLRGTPLHAAAAGGSVAIVELLLAAGADPAAQDCYHRTVLHSAASAEVARLFLARPDVPAPTGSVLVEHVAWSRTEIVALVLAHGVGPNEQDTRGRTALYQAHTAEMVRLLVAGGADPHVVDDMAMTPLHGVTWAGAARELLAAGADPHATDDLGRTPLHVALEADLVALLLTAGVPVDVLDVFGRTPLWHRAWHPMDYYYLRATPGYRPQEECVRAVRTLLAAGADPARRDRDGVAPIHHLRRPLSSFTDDDRSVALRALLRDAVEAALGPGLRSRISTQEASRLPQHAAAVHPRGTEAVTAVRDGVLVRWALGPHAPRPVEVVATERVPHTVLACSPDGTLLACGGGDRQPVELRRWDRLDDVVAVLEDVDGSSCLSFSADGRLLAVGWWATGASHGAAVVDVARARRSAANTLYHGVEQLAFAPDGALAIAWMDDQYSFLHRVRADLSDVDEYEDEDGHGHIACRARGLAFSGDGGRLAVCGAAPYDAAESDAEPGMIAVWDPARMVPIWTVLLDRSVKRELGWSDPPVIPRSACFVADDRWLAVGLRGGVLVLDAGTGEIVRSSRGWPQDVHGIHAVPGDAAVVVAAEDGLHRIQLDGEHLRAWP